MGGVGAGSGGECVEVCRGVCVLGQEGVDSDVWMENVWMSVSKVCVQGWVCVDSCQQAIHTKHMIQTRRQRLGTLHHAQRER